ncbi:hypothetical protein [Mycobacterium sp. E3198]|uniref:hypothetical protein n=1 Tax=Mycobacterium sp. E3198 TaxID=1834143 RepID=UPI000AFF0EF8|nr:hypothetical protein [Mycobacterium sp. E3198]
MKPNAVLPVEKRHSEGSFGFSVDPDTTARHDEAEGIALRVSEYMLAADGTDTDPDSRTYRLIPTITDPAAAPARNSPKLHPAVGVELP